MADITVHHRIRDKRRDRLKQLRAFCHAARLGSFTKAAEHVHSSQPSASLHIHKLELDLGVSLFVRGGPRIVLTAEGRDLYRRALPLVENIDRVPDTFAELFEDLAGPLHIGADETAASYLLPRYVGEFNRLHADVKATIRTGSGSECLWWLRGYEVDMVFAAIDVEPLDLEFHFLVASPFELITPEGHPLAELSRAGPHDLRDHSQVAHTRQSYIRDSGDMVLRQHGVEPDVAVEVDGWETIKDYVEAGLGIAIVPDLCLTERDLVCRIPYVSALPPQRYGCVTRRERIAPLTVQRFMEVLGAARSSADETAGQSTGR